MEGIDALHPEVQGSIRTAAVLYREIGRQIAAGGPPRYWGRRSVVGRWRKAALTLGWLPPRPAVSAQASLRPTGAPLQLLREMRPALPGL